MVDKEGRTLGPQPETEVVKFGLRRLREALGSEGLLDFPRRPNGTPLLMRQGFFERLVRGDASLQDCAAADASAGEGDVKKLSLKQLVAIRCNHLDYTPTGANQQSKANFLKLTERWTVTMLAERILGEEAKTMTEGNRALVMNHVILMYGAYTQLGGVDDPVGSEWWLLCLAGTRRYMHLASCEASSSMPSGSVYCHRVLATPTPRGASREPSFKWQVQLVDKPEDWKSEVQAASVPQATDACGGETPATRSRETPANKASGATEVAAPRSVTKISKETRPPGGKSIDDFFDSLLAETSTVSSELKMTPSQVRKAGGQLRRPTSDLASPAVPTAPAVPPSASAATAAGYPAAATAPAAQPKPTSVSAAAPGPQLQPPTVSAPATPPANKDEEQEQATGADAASSAAPPSSPPPPPLNPAQERLCAALIRFYRSQESTDKLSNVDKIARKYAGEGIVDMWAALGGKYSLPPPTAVQWLSGTLDSNIAIQWPRESVPVNVQKKLEELREKSASDPKQEGAAKTAARDAELKAALDSGETEVASALAFSAGCTDPALRPRLWRTLLRWMPLVQQDVEQEISQDGNCREEEEQVRLRRSEYVELRTRMTAAVPPLPTQAATGAPVAGEEPGGETGMLESGAALRAEVEGDAKSAWRGEAFVSRTEVADAIVNIVLTHAWQSSQYIPGSCELATVLLFAISTGGCGNVSEAEADTFWCFSQFMAEVQETVCGDAGLADQVRRTHELLRAYDLPLAELLAGHGLGALPVMRLGAALCTRSGFALAECVRIWDTLLADPQRFAFCDYIVVALLLLIRGDLMQCSDMGSLCETLVAAAHCVDVDTMLNTAHAICAFERRCVIGATHPFPARPAPGPDILEGGSFGVGGFDNAVAVAQTRLTSLWGLVRTKSADAWEVGRLAANEAADKAPTWKANARSRLAAAAATAASAAGTAATAAASAAGQAATVAATAAEKAATQATAAMEAVKAQQAATTDEQPPALVAAPLETGSAVPEAVPQLVAAPP